MLQFKGEKRDVAQIAAQLKVRMVLEGSVRKQAEKVPKLERPQQR